MASPKLRNNSGTYKHSIIIDKKLNTFTILVIFMKIKKAFVLYFNAGAMKKIFYTIILTACISASNQVLSQNIAVKQSIDSINAILSANPYHDGFNDISFYYSVNITQEKELVVEMSFDGPFKWIYTAKISDLDISPKPDICRESPGSFCWICRKADTGEQTSCVKAEMILNEGGSEKENASNICVSFSSRANICSDLNRRFQQLFLMVMSGNW